MADLSFLAATSETGHSPPAVVRLCPQPRTVLAVAAARPSGRALGEAGRGWQEISRG